MCIGALTISFVAIGNSNYVICFVQSTFLMAADTVGPLFYIYWMYRSVMYAQMRWLSKIIATKKALLRDRKRRTTHGVFCLWRLLTGGKGYPLSWSWLGEGGSMPCLGPDCGGRSSPVVGPDWGTPFPPLSPWSEPGQVVHLPLSLIKDLGPETTEGTWDQRPWGTPAPPPPRPRGLQTNWKHYLLSYVVRGQWWSGRKIQVLLYRDEQTFKLHLY